MADLKISALPTSTTPLAGIEVLPIVQSGATKQVSVANLTAGRTVGANTLLMGGAAAAGVFAGEIGMPNAAGIRMRNGANTGYYNVMYLDGSNIFQIASAGISTVFGGSVTVGATVTLTNGNLVFGTAGKGVSLPGGITWTSGSGSPEGVVTAPVGSLYSRSNGGAGTSLYVKESGSGNTGWGAK